MKKRALFVGVDEYEDGSISNLEYAVEDAYGLASAFETLLGFERVDRLRNPRGKKDILRKVREVTSGLGKGDLFFFYFAGHGFRVKDNHVLVCAEDEYRYLEEEDDGLRMGLLKTEARGPWNRMLVIDACQNDIRKHRGADGGMSARDLSLILEDGEAGAESGDGVQVVVTSCSEGQRALEVRELGHGLFTSALLETVKEHARERRRLDLAGFRLEMAERMGRLAREHCLQGKQNPMFKIPGECGIVLLEGEKSEIRSQGGGRAGAAAGELCETCGRYRPLTELFKCQKCGKWHCVEHQDRRTWLCGGCVAEQQRKAERQAGETKRIILPGGAEMEFAWCPPGKFMMGSPESEEGRDNNETQHWVTLTKGFWMARTPVTQKQWKSVMGNNPARYIGFDMPIETLSWAECSRFCLKTGLAFTTEAEWEYACRAGTTGAYGGTGRLEEMGWFAGNSGGRMHPVGQKKANAWGLYDMHGNVWEWCVDIYRKDLGSDAVTDPMGPVSGLGHVVRGGGFWYDPQNCRSASRMVFFSGFRIPGYGFRPVLRPV